MYDLLKSNLFLSAVSFGFMVAAFMSWHSATSAHNKSDGNKEMIIGIIFMAAGACVTMAIGRT